MKLLIPTALALAISTAYGADICDAPQNTPFAKTFAQETHNLPSASYSVTDGDVISIGTSGYTLKIKKNKFKISLINAVGETVLSEFASRGLHFRGSNGKDMDTYLCENNTGLGYLRFVVENEHTYKADVVIWPRDNTIRFSVTPRSTDTSKDNNIALLFSGLNDAVYGLGDFGKEGNLHGTNNLKIEGNGHGNRFVSTFGVVPARRIGFAQMLQGDERLYSDVSQRVTLRSDKLMLKAENVSSVRHSYLFIGDTLKDVYRAFKEAKQESGYGDVKPIATAFGIGWEAWPQFGYGPTGQNVYDNIDGFYDNGYSLDWAVLGSGFWEPGGTTTSFNRWNNSRYNPTEFRTYFSDKNISLMFGLRPNFPLSQFEAQQALALAQDLVVKDENGEPVIFSSWEFPKNVPMYVLDAFNPNAVDYWVKKTAEWGVQGWKEDSMWSPSWWVSGANATAYHDGFANPLMSALHERGDIVMARNAYMTNPGSIHRINDTSGEQKRIPQLVLAYASSGSPNVYTDSIGNGNTGADYLVRHSLLSAMTATMAFGRKPWELSSDRASASRRAANWHTTYLPTIYSAGVDTYETGYPYTATPLHIAYPGDTNTYNLDDSNMWQWMIGESMLAHPAFANGGYTRDVYLPEGKWIDYDTGEEFIAGYSGMTLSSYDHSMNRIPVFVGGKGVVIREEGENKQTVAQIWPVKMSEIELTAQFTHTDGVTKYSIINATTSGVGNATVTDLTTNQQVNTWIDNWGNSAKLKFAVQPGHHYRVSN